MKNFFKKNWFGITALSISFIVLFYSVFFTGDAVQFKETINEVNFWWVIWGAFFILIFWALDGFCLHYITLEQYSNYKILQSIKTAIIGIFYSALTPFAVGGQPMQIVDMSNNGVDPGDATSIITVKTIIYQCCLTFYGVITFLFTYKYFVDKVPNLYLFFILGLLLNIIFISAIILICLNKKITHKCATFIISSLQKIKIIKNPDKVSEKIFNHISLFHKSYLLINKKRKTIILITFFTFLQLSALYLVPFCVYNCFGLKEASLLYIISANAMITIITAFVPLPGGSVAAEGSFYLFFSLFIPAVAIFPAIFLWRILTYYLCIIVGGLINFFSIVLPRCDKKKDYVA